MSIAASFARLFFSFSGRVGRSGFWLVSLVWFVLVEAFSYWWDQRGFIAAAAYDHALVNAALVVGSLPAIVSAVAVSVRRLHDRNKSAWWLIPMGVVPPVLQAVGSLNSLDSALAVTLMVVSVALSLWALVELGFMPGTTGPNRFGLDPRLDIGADAG